MKINGVIIKEEGSDQYFSYVRQFPGICAQADSVEEVTTKVNAYFHKYIESIQSKDVEMDSTQIQTIGG